MKIVYFFIGMVFGMVLLGSVFAGERSARVFKTHIPGASYGNNFYESRFKAESSYWDWRKQSIGKGVELLQYDCKVSEIAPRPDE